MVKGVGTMPDHNAVDAVFDLFANGWARATYCLGPMFSAENGENLLCI
jgi:hypothetical protein